MKVIRFYFFLSIALLINLGSFAQPKIEIFPTLSGLSIRALEVWNDQTIWFAANRGVWGYTQDGGKTFHIDSIQIEGKYPEFRSMAVLNDSTVLLLSISSPAYLFKTTNKGKSWRVVYQNKDTLIFFDAMIFKDKKNGMAIADPIDQSVQIIRTQNQGETWTKMSEDSTPVILNSTAFFASSNSNIEWKKDKIWFCTGGDNANVWLNENNAITFDRYETPLPEGGPMTGIYSMDFWDSKKGIIAGGDYDQADTSITVLAFSKDGGKNWMKIDAEFPMFGSCVQFISKNEIVLTGKPGTFHYDLKNKKWQEWKSSHQQSIGFHTVRISSSKNVIWFAGADGSIGRLMLND